MKKASKPHKITAEDFDAWKENAITRAVLAHLQEVADAARNRWLGYLEGEVPADPRFMQMLHVELKAKLEFIAQMQELELSDIQEEDDATGTDADKRSA